MDNVRALRLAAVTIENFRAISKARLLLKGLAGAADRVAVLHGDNGSGKSTALAAIDLAIRAILTWLKWKPTNSGSEFSLPWNSRDSDYGLQVFERDWPPGVTSPMLLDLAFENEEVGRLLVTLTRSGSAVLLGVQRSTIHTANRPAKISPDDCAALRTALETPRGSASQPFSIIDASRRLRRVSAAGAPANVNTAEVPVFDQLYEMSTSDDPADRDRWRAFQALVAQFPTLAGKEVSIESRRGSVQLVVEERRKSVLLLSNLSSGEQQVARIAAALLTSRASIVAIEEPEISLSPRSQELLKNVLYSQVERGVIDQLLIESHVPAFDGPDVLRFCVENAVTTVSRNPGRVDSEPDVQLTAAAAQAGAQKEWVTPGGFTKLPADMVSELGLGQGGYLWFFKEDERWSAFPPQDLSRILDEGAEKPAGGKGN
jgi:energy-coupling factor transporter ATP-binding protein EcfA2